jgi:hypothetical protein
MTTSETSIQNQNADSAGSDLGGLIVTVDPSPAPAPSIFLLMSRVMADIGAVGKGDYNSQQNYSFRGIDSVMNAVHGAMVKHGVTVTPEVLDKEYGSYRTKNGTEMRTVTVTVRYTFYGPRGDSVEVVTLGEASDSADKATNKALSAAMKYALLHTFVVPTTDVVKDDADRTTAERGPQTTSLSKYINQQLNKEERAALRKMWKSDFDFATDAVPFEREQDCRTLIDSFVGTSDPGRPFTDEGAGAVADGEAAADAAAYEAGQS